MPVNLKNLISDKPASRKPAGKAFVIGLNLGDRTTHFCVLKSG
jgi:hypothetical protein